MARHSPQQLIFLGDFLHAAAARTASMMAALALWRKQHADVQMTLVRGNHDSRAGDPPASLRIEVVDEPYLQGPFARCHRNCTQRISCWQGMCIRCAGWWGGTATVCVCRVL